MNAATTNPFEFATDKPVKAAGSTMFSKIVGKMSPVQVAPASIDVKPKETTPVKSYNTDGKPETVAEVKPVEVAKPVETKKPEPVAPVEAAKPEVIDNRNDADKLKSKQAERETLQERVSVLTVEITELQRLMKESSMIRLRTEMRSLGIDPSEFITRYGSSTKAPKAVKEASTREPAEAKFKDPATGDEWSGRGRLSTWLQAKKDAGEKLSKYVVPGLKWDGKLTAKSAANPVPKVPTWVQLLKDEGITEDKIKAGF